MLTFSTSLTRFHAVDKLVKTIYIDFKLGMNIDKRVLKVYTGISVALHTTPVFTRNRFEQHQDENIKEKIKSVNM